MKPYIFYCAAILLYSISLESPASDNKSIIGYVKNASPSALILNGELSNAAQAGSPVYINSILKTDHQGSIGLILKDNTQLSIGPETEMQLNDYAFNPVENQLGLTLSLAQGTLHYISGIIAKLRPEQVTIKTPSNIIGIRGTRLLVKVEN